MNVMERKITITQKDLTKIKSILSSMKSEINSTHDDLIPRLELPEKSIISRNNTAGKINLILSLTESTSNLHF